MALWTLFGLASGKATTDWPKQGHNDGQEGVFGMPRYHADACSEGCEECANVCPTHAIEARERALAVDYGRCIVCNLCTEACPTGAMERSNDWAFGVRERADLVWSQTGKEPSAPATLERKAFRRSLHIRHVDAGSCNGCESELQALNNPFYNLHRLGIFFTPSPRFADLLLVTGPVTNAMHDPLKAAYDAMPEPRWVMAVGTCAVSGGIAGGNYACGTGLDGVLPVDVYLPGCPPNPAAIMEALLMFLERAPQRVEEGGSVVSELLTLAALLWAAGAVLALVGASMLSRILLVVGVAAGILAAIVSLPAGSPMIVLPTALIGEPVSFRIDPEGLWLMGFGLLPAGFACALASPSARGARGWQFGAAMSLLGAIGVFGLQNGAALLIAWELMSLGGAVMIVGENLEPSRGRTVLFMLALLEVGAVALVLAITILGVRIASLQLSDFVGAAGGLSEPAQVGMGLLFLIGFGAKLGLLPFYEWFPGAYGSGSGASGAIMSGVVLNAAFFALSRALFNWLPASPDGAFPALAMIVIVVATLSAILTILYAFQQDDWRSLLSFSSAENASVAVVALGAALIFRTYHLNDLAGLAWIVALLHLAGHALAKGTLFLTADAMRKASGGYHIAYAGAGSHWPLGIGALLAAMSLAAMPPTAGFVSEWFVFQTVFQGFHLPTLGGRLLLALTGAGLALTAAVAFATFVKLMGLGVLSRSPKQPARIQLGYSVSVGLLGLFVLALGVGMPWWLQALDHAASAQFGVATASQMRDGLLLVPLTAKFAFTSPSLLIVVMPLLALLPIIMIVVSSRRAIRRTAVWYGGLSPDPALASTTALTFSNAMRTFYSFVYRPTADTERDAGAGGYFVKRLVFEHDVAPIFGPWLFQPAVRIVNDLAGKLRLLQSGHLNFYLSLVGLLLVLILGLTLF